MLSRLADRPLLRRALAAALAASGRRHLAGLDRLAPPRAQLRTLTGLVHKARHTPFGRDHDFRRVRSVADFQRLVPLRTPAELARDYPHPASPAANTRRALRTALALLQAARPLGSLLAGRLVWLGDGDPSAAFPLLLRPFACTLAELAGRPASVLVGPPDRVAAAAVRVPVLTGAVCLRRDHREAGPSLRQALGAEPAVVELLLPPAGPVAVEDARRGGLRLLADHGSFYELIPAAEAGSPQPTRLTPEQARPGEVYELALSGGGLWACRTGLHLAFAEGGAVRPVAAPRPTTVRRDAATPLPPAAHRPTFGTPAARPGTPFRSPWSAPADRGS